MKQCQCNGYSTGEQFSKALAEAVQPKNKNWEADIAAIQKFMIEHTGFRPQSVSVIEETFLTFKGIAK